MQDAQTAETAAQTDTRSAAPDKEPALPLRSDTFLGVCAALGQEFHIPADILRIGFAALFFWSMPLAVGTYLAIGAVVALARWAYPAVPSAATAKPVAPDNPTEAVEGELPLAA